MLAREIHSPASSSALEVRDTGRRQFQDLAAGLPGISGLGPWCQDNALDSDSSKAGAPTVWPAEQPGLACFFANLFPKLVLETCMAQGALLSPGRRCR